jgi:hypothetical protein
MAQELTAMQKNYKPRRASKRWLDADCPAGVLAILDHPNFTDRFTVLYSEPVAGNTYADMFIGYRGMSANPFHPQGVGMYGEMRVCEAAAYRYRNKHRYARWSALPDAVKRCVCQDLEAQP